MSWRSGFIARGGVGLLLRGPGVSGCRSSGDVGPQERRSGCGPPTDTGRGHFAREGGFRVDPVASAAVALLDPWQSRDGASQQALVHSQAGGDLPTGQALRDEGLGAGRQLPEVSAADLRSGRAPTDARRLAEVGMTPPAVRDALPPAALEDEHAEEHEGERPGENQNIEHGGHLPGDATTAAGLCPVAAAPGRGRSAPGPPTGRCPNLPGTSPEGPRRGPLRCVKFQKSSKEAKERGRGRG